MVHGLSEDEISWVEKYFDLSEGNERPLAIWIIGRPAAGKTTTATLLRDVLQREGYSVKLVDGEAVRSALNSFLGYSSTDRLSAFKKYVHINQLLQKRGIIPITATIGGFRQFRQIVRTTLQNPKFIYLDCPFNVAAKRDQKNLYARALAGEVENFFDIDIPYEIPGKYEMRVNSAKLKPHEIVATIFRHFGQAGLLRKMSTE